VRRVYGRFVCNGKEVYTKKRLTIPANVKPEEVREISGEYIPQTIAVSTKDPAGQVTLDGTNGAVTVHYTHTVNTLHFVPDHARDVSIIDQSMRCKIGVGTDPADEAGAAGDITETAGVYSDLSTHTLGLDRFFKAAPGNAYSGAATKNNMYEEDGANVMFAGAPTQVAWGYGAVPGVGGQVTVPEAYVGGIGVPFVDGMNRPILCKNAGISFEGWVEILPEDSSFYLGCNFQSHQESPNLVSGSDLTNASPLLVKLQYDEVGNSSTNLYEARDPSDQFTSFVAVDSVLRILPNGDVVSSV
jgi:hypothetical protein